MFELASKIYDGVYDPVYVSDLNHALGLKGVIISNSYSKLNTTEGTPVQIGDYFDLTNTNGLNLLTYVKELNFNNSNATKIPNLFNNVTTMDRIVIQNENSLLSTDSFNNLTTVNNEIIIKNNSIGDFNFSSLRNVGINFNIETNVAQIFSANNLENVNSFSLISNSVNRIDLPSLNLVNSLIINSSNLTELNLNGLEKNITNISVENSKLANLDFMQNVSKSININASFKNNINLQNIDFSTDRIYNSLNLLSLSENIYLFPLTNTKVINQFLIDNKNYTKKIGFNSSLCKKLNYNANYCYQAPVATTDINNMSANISQTILDSGIKTNIIKVTNPSGVFSFDVALSEDYSIRNKLQYTTTQEDDNYKINIENHGNFLRITGTLNGIYDKKINILVNETDNTKVGYENPVLLTSLFVTDKDLSSGIIIIDGDTTGYVNSGDKIVFSKPGQYTLTAYYDLGTIKVKSWGAGGGVANLGGKGGYTEVNYKPVTGQVYKIIVGGAGGSWYWQAGGYGGGGYSGRDYAYSYSVGSGGGLSGLFINSYLHENALIIAGGGGGGSNNKPGGNGGGSVGLNGVANGNGDGGIGGSQTTGGYAPEGAYGYGNAGSALQGGNAYGPYGGGGGGGGYYGGSSGGKNNYQGGSGAGGSGFILGSIKNISGANPISTTWSIGSSYYTTVNDAPSTTTGMTQGNGALVFVLK